VGLAADKETVRSGAKIFALVRDTILIPFALAKGWHLGAGKAATDDGVVEKIGRNKMIIGLPKILQICGI
jgi:hypothetical protein